MQAELIEMGAALKKRREEKNLSQKEVENATSIRANYIDFIEQGHLGKLISPVYAQGFIKKYATFLGVDPDALLEQYPSVLHVLNEKSNDDFPFLNSMEVRGSPSSEVKWLPNLLWVLSSVALILGGWFLARKFGIL